LAGDGSHESRSRGMSAWIALRGVFYGSCFVALWTSFAVLVRRFDEHISFALPSLLAPIGFIVAVAGALLSGSCLFAFITRGRGTAAPFDPPREFVAVGPYRYVRNPMYVGGFAVLLGAGLALRSPSILVLAGIFALWAHLFVVYYEEPGLTKRFGENYRRYKEITGRWLPKWR